MTIKLTGTYYSQCYKGAALPNIRVHKKFDTPYAVFVKTRRTPTTGAEYVARRLFEARVRFFKSQNPSSSRPNVFPLREAARTSYPDGTARINLKGSFLIYFVIPGQTLIAPILHATPPPITTPSPMPC